MAIRPAQPEEAELLTGLAVRSKASWGYDRAFMAACRAELAVTPASIAEHPTFVFETRGEIDGFYPLIIAAGRADLALFFVEPPAMRSGIGRTLWHHLEEEASRRSARQITVDSDPHAAGFYLRMGARPEGFRRSLSILGRLLPYLVKNLP